MKPKAPHSKRVHQFFEPLPCAPTPIPQRFPHEGAEGKKRKSISPKMFCREKRIPRIIEHPAQNQRDLFGSTVQ